MLLLLRVAVDCFTLAFSEQKSLTFESLTFPDFYFTILIFVRYSQVHVILAFD